MTLNLKNSCIGRTKHAPSIIWSFLIFNKLVRNIGLKAMLHLADKRRLIALAFDGICNHCNTVFEAMVCYFLYCLRQEARPSLTGNEIMRGIKKGNKTKCAKIISNRKDTKLLKCGSAIGGIYTKLMRQ